MSLTKSIELLDKLNEITALDVSLDTLMNRQRREIIKRMKQRNERVGMFFHKKGKEPAFVNGEITYIHPRRNWCKVVIVAPLKLAGALVRADFALLHDAFVLNSKTQSPLVGEMEFDVDPEEDNDEELSD